MKRAKYFFRNERSMAYLLNYLSQIMIPISITTLEIKDKYLANNVIVERQRIIKELDTLRNNINDKLKS